MTEIFSAAECPQGSEQWFALHMGIPTASEFFKVMAKVGPRGGTSHKEYVQRMQYMRILAGEIITGEPREHEWAGNRHTERGKANESAARALYAMLNEVEPVEVGFIRNGSCGCSPDSLIDEDGGLEIKDVLPHRQIENLESGVLPSAYKWQVLGSIHVTGRAWWDFMSHCRGLPPFIYRVERENVTDELAELSDGIERFNEELALMVKRVEAMW